VQASDVGEVHFKWEDVQPLWNVFPSSFFHVFILKRVIRLMEDGSWARWCFDYQVTCSPIPHEEMTDSETAGTPEPPQNGYLVLPSGRQPAR